MTSDQKIGCGTAVAFPPSVGTVKQIYQSPPPLHCLKRRSERRCTLVGGTGVVRQCTLHGSRLPHPPIPRAEHPSPVAGELGKESPQGLAKTSPRDAAPPGRRVKRRSRSPRGARSGRSRTWPPEHARAEPVSRLPIDRDPSRRPAVSA